MPGDKGSGTISSGAQPQEEPIELSELLAELDTAPTKPYYVRNADLKERKLYYLDRPKNLKPAEFYDWLNNLLTTTHTNPVNYKPHMYVYPWVDLRANQPEPVLKSIYSDEELDPRDLITADFDVYHERLRRMEKLEKTGGLDEIDLDMLEAAFPFNCEHVVPQSWFGKKEPMRGDLHHLFACDTRCNSFRNNTPYYDFPDFEEALRTDCGKTDNNRFEPFGGKGTIARAVLYFLLRYPGKIDQTENEYTPDRIAMLLKWHKTFKVTNYERHRNQAIFAIQGNRNPLIDYPSWSTKIEFTKGLA
jgi:endonuclease I